MTVSATTGAGLGILRQRIAEALDVDLLAERPEITNVRHLALLQRAYDRMAGARSQVKHALADPSVN